MNLKRILALAGIVIIAAWVVVTFVLAVMHAAIFKYFMFGCIALPIILWLAIWFVGLLTGKKTIASFRTEEMEKTMEEAERIKEAMAEKESKADNE